jgi:hypothetical protein
LVVTGCIAAVSEFADPLADQSFLTQEPCAAPCWYGLELDKSNKVDVYAVLGKLSFVDETTIKELPASWSGDQSASEILFGCSHPSDTSCGGVLLSGDKLKRMWFSVGYELTAETAVEQLGLPAYIDYGPYSAEIESCIIDLAWPGKGILLRYLNKTTYAQCQTLQSGNSVSSNIKIATIYYLAQEGFGSEPTGCCKRISWPGFARP